MTSSEDPQTSARGQNIRNNPTKIVLNHMATRTSILYTAIELCMMYKICMMYKMTNKLVDVPTDKYNTSSKKNKKQPWLQVPEFQS